VAEDGGGAEALAVDVTEQVVVHVRLPRHAAASLRAPAFLVRSASVRSLVDSQSLPPLAPPPGPLLYLCERSGATWRLQLADAAPSTSSSRLRSMCGHRCSLTHGGEKKQAFLFVSLPPDLLPEWLNCVFHDSMLPSVPPWTADI
jgi:hypothetical protein